MIDRHVATGRGCPPNVCLSPLYPPEKSNKTPFICLVYLFRARILTVQNALVVASGCLRYDCIILSNYRYSTFLADRTATQYDRQLASSCCPFVCPSVCDAVHSHSQGWYTGLKVTPACSQQACSYLYLQTLFLQDVSFSHKTHCKERSEKRHTCLQTQATRKRRCRKRTARCVNNDTLSMLCRDRTVELCYPSNLLLEYSASTLAITMNSIKIDITQWLFLPIVLLTACSTIGYHSNS